MRSEGNSDPSNHVCLVVRALNLQSSCPSLKTTRWFHSQLSFSSFQGQSKEYHELLET